MLLGLTLSGCRGDGYGELVGRYGEEFGEVASVLWIEASTDTWRTVHPDSYGVTETAAAEILIPRLLVTSQPLRCRDLQDQVEVVGVASAAYVATAGTSATLPESCGAYDRFIQTLVDAGIESIPRPYVAGGPSLWLDGSGRNPTEGHLDARGSTSTWWGPVLAETWDRQTCDQDWGRYDTLLLSGEAEITSVSRRWVELTLSAELYTSSGSESDPFAGEVEARLTARRCTVAVPEVWVW